MKTRRILAVIFCLALVISLATAVFATPSTLLLEDLYGGYDCYGYGSFGISEATASFQTYTNRPSHVPESECDCFVSVQGYHGDIISVAYSEQRKETYGTSASVSAITHSILAISYIECHYIFIGNDFGFFNLY